MDLIHTGYPKLPLENESLQEKALDFAIEKARSEITMRKQLTYFLMGLVGLAFLVLTVMLIFFLLGKAIPLLLFSPFVTATVTGGGYMLRNIIAALFPTKQTGMSDGSLTF